MIGTILRVRYELLQELGAGPVFHAYIAHDRVSERNVVIRIVREPFGSESEFIHRLREVVAETSMLAHQHVSSPLDLDEHNGRWFLASTYAPGQSLAIKLSKVQGFGISTSVSIAVKILEALSFLHDHEVVHGDVRLENVVLSSKGETTLLLPGVWKAYSASETAGLKMLPKMAPYLAPEVSAGSQPSKSSDVYALGVLLYEMLTGVRPFPQASLSELSQAHAAAPCPSIRKRLTSAPEALDRIVEKALEKSPAKRYKDAKQMLADLRLLQDGLRFGKQVSWPLEIVEPQGGPRIAPKMNVVWAEERRKKMAERRIRDTGDGAPAWLVYTCITLSFAAILVIGWWMFFRLNAPKTLRVPNIVGMSFTEASAQLDGMHLKLRQTKQQPSEQYPEGVILAVRPAVDREVKEHGFIDATVSSGSKFVEVPELAGKSIEEARRLLSKMGLALSEKMQQVFDESVPSGLIVSQRPAKHTQVKKSSEVYVEVSKGKAVIVPDEPPALEPYLYHLSWTMPDGTQSIRVRVEMRDGAGQKTIYEARHEPNDKVEIDVEGLGESATFTIYYDDRVVKTLTQNAERPEDSEPPPADPDPDTGGDT